MAKKRKQKLGRELKRRDKPVEMDAKCESCGISHEGPEGSEDIVYCDGCNLCYLIFII